MEGTYLQMAKASSLSTDDSLAAALEEAAEAMMILILCGDCVGNALFSGSWEGNVCVGLAKVLAVMDERE